MGCSYGFPAQSGPCASAGESRGDAKNKPARKNLPSPDSEKERIVVCGGGAAGFFAAATCARNAPEREVVLLEKGSHFLSKVRISGGGRCNVTHACFDPRALAMNYPRGGRALIGPFHRFQPRDTVEWFASRGVRLKREPDGRMFPVTDRSETIIDCLMNEARASGVRLVTQCGLESVGKLDGSGFELTLTGNQQMRCKRLLLAMGGCRAPGAAKIAESLGHSVEPPVPSLFTFHIHAPWLTDLSGVSVEDVEVSAPDPRLRQRGALLATHWGISGPAVLKLSAWGARAFHARGYQFGIEIDWLPATSASALMERFSRLRQNRPGKQLHNTPVENLPSRLWERLIQQARIPEETRWSTVSRAQLETLARQIKRSELQVSGKSLNKDEFVTAGGVSLKEVDFKTMESRICAGLYFAGEYLDIDGVTGGFNFQAAWTTGWIAGEAMARDD